MMSIRSSFQEKTFKNKIIESRFKVHVVDQLVAAARQEKISRTIGDDRGHGNVQSTDWQFMYNLPFIIPSLILRVFRSRQRSAIDGGLPDFVEYSEQIARSLQTRGYESVATAPPLTDHKAKIMARMTFHYLSCGRKILTREDFSRIIKNETASCDAYAIFDADGDGTITRSEFRSAVVKVFREQRNLGQSIANTGSALSVLDTISMIVVGAGLFLLLLALLGVKVQNILGVSASFILGMNFIIYDAANKTFHALLFLFVMHPYDIGDRVVIGKDIGYGDEDVMTVAHINIQNTVFRRWNSLLVSIPNHILAGGPVSNLSRGTEQWERIEFSLEAPDSQRLTVDEETNRLADMRHRIETFVLQYPQDYYQSFELRAVIAADSAKSEKNLDAIKFVLKIRCKETLDSQKKWIRHARILAFVKTVVKQVGVELAAIAA
jgi:small-conductance mechanosensitive channel